MPRQESAQSQAESSRGARTPSDDEPRTLARARRRELDLTMAEVARRAAISPSTLFRIETGRTRPNGPTRMLLAGVLGLDPERLTDPAEGLR